MIILSSWNKQQHIWVSRKTHDAGSHQQNAGRPPASDLANQADILYTSSTSNWRADNRQNLLDYVLGPPSLKQPLNGAQLAAPLHAPLLGGLDHLDAVQVHLAGGDTYQCRGDELEPVKGREGPDQLVEVPCRLRGDPPCDGTMHAQERDKIHLVAKHVDVDGGAEGELAEV